MIDGFMYVSNLDREFPGLKNTLVCSFSRLEDFLYHATKMPFYDRPTVTANCGIPDNTVFYVDDEGFASKFIIPKGVDSDWDEAIV